MGLFGSRSGIEPPPAAWAGQPSLTGQTQQRNLPDAASVSQACIATGGFSLRPGQYVRACYDPVHDTLIMPTGDPDQQELQTHENAHPAGWRHTQDGSGTNWAGSLKPANMSPDDWFGLLQQHGWQPGQRPSLSTGGQGEIAQRQPPPLTGSLSPVAPIQRTGLIGSQFAQQGAAIGQ